MPVQDEHAAGHKVLSLSGGAFFLTASITYCDGSSRTGPDAVERLVERAPAVSLCNLCFPGIGLGTLRRQHAWHAGAAHS